MKRQYEVAESEVQREDDSFKLCFCTMLIFLALMVLTCVCFWPRNMVQKKMSQSNTVHDSWSGHLGSRVKPTSTSTDKSITTSTGSETTISTTLTSRRTLPTVSKLATDKIFPVNYTSTTEVPATSDIIYNTSDDVLTDVPDEKEFDQSVQTSVQEVTVSEKPSSALTETVNGEETVEKAVITSETTFKSTSSSSTDSSTLLGNINFDTFPDSSENTIPYNLSSGVMNVVSSTIGDFTSKTAEDISTSESVNEVSTKQTEIALTTEVSDSTSALTSTEENLELTSGSVSLLMTNTEDDTAVEEDFQLGLIANSSEESSLDSLGSDLMLDNSTVHVILLSTNDIITTSSDSPLSQMDNTNSEISLTQSIDSDDVLVDLVSDNSSTEPTCLKCPETVCPNCLVQACTTADTISTPVLDNSCRSSQCHVVASRLLSLVNVSVDPCQDFYSYACGGLLSSQVLLEDDPALDVWLRIDKAVKNVSTASPSSHQKLKNYYDGCVNYDELVSLEQRKAQGREVIQSVGNFTEASTTAVDDLTELLIGLFKLGSGTLFSIGLDVDSTNSSEFQVVVSLPDQLSSQVLAPGVRSSRCRHKAGDGIPLNLTEAYEMYRNCMNNVSETLDRTRKALEFFQLLDHLPAHNSSQLIQEILVSVENLLELLKGLPPPNVAQADIQSKTYKLVSGLQLESEIPQIAWRYLFSTLLDIELDNTTEVQVYFIDYIKSLFTQLQTEQSRSIHNSLLAMFAHDLYSDVAQTHNPSDRERYCLHVTARLLPTVTSNLYLTTFPSAVDQALRQQVKLIYQQLVSVMETKISAAAWLDERSLNELMTKLRLVSIQLPEMFSESQLTVSLGECDLGNKQYFEDSVCLLRQLQSHMFTLYTMDSHATKAMWTHFLTSFSTKPLFIYGLDTFLVPHTVVAPFYDKDMPKHVVLAQLGNILARGIGHNFDLTGMKFAASGKMLSEAMHSAAESSNLQFSWTKSHSEADHVYTYLLDPELTLNERLTDITAANLSLSLLSESEVEDSHLPWVPFSSKQVFFLTLAQTFCSKKKVPEIFPSLYEGTGLLPFDRVTNLAANSEQFAEVFRCPQGSNMNMHSEIKTRPFPLFEKEQLHVDGS